MTRCFVLVCAAAACRAHSPTRPPTEPPSADTGSTVPHVVDTSDTGKPTDPLPWNPAPVSPALVLTDPDPDFSAAVFDFGDTDADGRSELAIVRSEEMLVLAVDTLEGTHTPEDFLVATFPRLTGPSVVAHAGDTDHDGNGDLWLGSSLYRGPLRGTYSWSDAVATIVSPTGYAVAGGFDADGDGELDVALGGASMDFELHYGPFAGDRPGSGNPDFEDWDPTRLGRIDSCEPDSMWNLGALNEPGQVVLAAGCGTEPYYGGDIYLYDVRGPRGRTLHLSDSFASFDAQRFFDPIPDIDGDGLDDLLYDWNPVPKPVEGFIAGIVTDSTSTATGGFQSIRFTNPDGVFPVGDVTGDGLTDLTVQNVTFDADGAAVSRWYAVPGTTHGLEVDPATVGVLLELDAPESVFTMTSIDLDGDGLFELVAPHRDDYGGTVWIFSGADIAASFANPDPTEDVP